MQKSRVPDSVRVGRSEFDRIDALILDHAELERPMINGMIGGDANLFYNKPGIPLTYEEFGKRLNRLCDLGVIDIGWPDYEKDVPKEGEACLGGGGWISGEKVQYMAGNSCSCGLAEFKTQEDVKRKARQGKSEKLPLSYALTQRGGEVWERFFLLDWKYFFRLRISYQNESVSIITLNEDRVSKLMFGLKMYVDYLEVMDRKFLSPCIPFYWKKFPMGFNIIIRTKNLDFRRFRKYEFGLQDYRKRWLSSSQEFG